MRIVILYPRFEHFAIEERFASLQSLSRLTRFAGNVPVIRYDAASPLVDALRHVDADAVLLVTAPLSVSAPGLVEQLLAALAGSRADAAIPVANGSPDPRQIASRSTPYLTLREFEEYASGLEPSQEVVEWSDADPGIALIRADTLRAHGGTATQVLAGRRVVIARGAVIHRWAPLRAQDRADLVAMVDPAATNILDLGCAEGLLGAALKARQPCRVVGIELEPGAAAIAATRLDRVVAGDAEALVPSLGETFDTITAGDLLEHVADPWTLLRNLRTSAREGCRLVAAMPNAGHGSIVADLLAGRFDYVYIGITCVGHLRFYTRESIVEMMRSSGWTVASIVPADEFRTAAAERLAETLQRGGIQPGADFFVPGYYVVATPESDVIKDHGNTGDVAVSEARAD
jgi:2-polyprenyl-3-methyl-5-hydroxy-6-metoxy-1,4-benzoquinol methylase